MWKLFPVKFLLPLQLFLPFPVLSLFFDIHDRVLSRSDMLIHILSFVLGALSHGVLSHRVLSHRVLKDPAVVLLRNLSELLHNSVVHSMLKQGLHDFILYYGLQWMFSHKACCWYQSRIQGSS